jgi:hypothetical protein
LRPLRRTSSLPPVLPSSMPRDVEVVAPCMLFGEGLHTAGAFASSFAPPGAATARAAAAAVRPPVTPHAPAASRAESAVAVEATTPTATAATVHSTPEKLHHSAVQVDSSPLGLVGDDYRTPRYSVHGAGSPNRILQFDSANPMKRSMSDQSSDGGRRKRTRSVSTRQPTLTQLWQSWELSSSSSTKDGQAARADVSGSSS